MQHENYNEFIPALPYDIAILEFTTAADVNRPDIALAPLPPDDTNDFSHPGCTVIGWGRYSKLSARRCVILLYFIILIILSIIMQ